MNLKLKKSASVMIIANVNIKDSIVLSMCLKLITWADYDMKMDNIKIPLMGTLNRQ